MRQILKFILAVVVLYIIFMGIWFGYTKLQEDRNQEEPINPYELCPVASIDILNVVLSENKAYISVSNSGKIDIDIINSSLTLDNVTYFGEDVPKTIGQGQPGSITFENVSYMSCPESFKAAFIDTPCPGVRDIFRGAAKCE